jgi:hypothetical protein
MIIILGRRNAPPRVITGVTHYHGWEGSSHFGWFRGGNRLGIGFTRTWVALRYTHVFVIEPTKDKPALMKRIF